MKLIFTCPVHQRTFETADFTIVENRGIVRAADGTARLDAMVAPERPCPHCGAMHRYRADELACPFGGSEERG